MLLLSAAVAVGCEPSWTPTVYRALTEERGLRPEGDMQLWGATLAAEVQRDYRREGFLAARVWHRVRSGCSAFSVDEGRIDRVRIMGVGTVARLTLADNVELLPGRILRRREVDRSVKQMANYRSVEGSWRIATGDGKRWNKLGQLVWRQRLDVQLGVNERVGLKVAIDNVQRFGVVTSLEYLHVNRRGQHLEGIVSLGTPYHRWATEQVPQVRWTYGSASVRWNQGEWSGIRLDVHLQNGLYQRLDLGVDRAYVTSGNSSFLYRFPGRPHVDVGFGVELTSPTGDIPLGIEDDTQLRGWLITRMGARSSRGPVRNDLQHSWSLEAQVGVNHLFAPVARLSLTGRSSLPVLNNWLLVKGLAVMREGELHFYDELPVGGKFQRVLFNDRYWTKRAMLGEVEYRQTVTKSLGIGVWHDASLFSPATGEKSVTIVNGIGPSIHVVYQVAAIRLAYGFGWSTDGQDPGQNLSLSISNAY